MKLKLPNISICVITYNRAQEMLELLKSMKKLKNFSEIVQEVIVMNNNSSDDYTRVEEFIKEYPELKIKGLVTKYR